jgi:hypothetical protein
VGFTEAYTSLQQIRPLKRFVPGTEDKPYKYEELATGYMKHHQHPTTKMYTTAWTTHQQQETLEITFLDTKTTLKLKATANLNKNLRHQGTTFSQQTFDHRAWPAIYLDQPHVKAERGIMKFIYRLKFDFENTYTLFMKPTASSELGNKYYAYHMQKPVTTSTSNK